MALQLRAKGITKVRPIEGGIDAWLAYNFPFVTESLVKKPVVLLEKAFFVTATAGQVRGDSIHGIQISHE